MKIILVACSKTKKKFPTLARYFYCSTWFGLASGYASKLCYPKDSDNKWFILSGKWGLLDPMQWVGPYDMSLRNLSDSRREQWARMVMGQLYWHIPEIWCVDGVCKHPSGVEFIFLAGEAYTNPLAAWLRDRNWFKVTTPLSGMGIGEQQAWLKAQLEGK